MMKNFLQKYKKILLAFGGHNILFPATVFVMGGLSRNFGISGLEMVTFLLLNPIIVFCLAIFFGATNPPHWTHLLYGLAVGLATIPSTLFVANQILLIYILGYAVVAVCGLAMGVVAKGILMAVSVRKQK